MTRDQVKFEIDLLHKDYQNKQLKMQVEKYERVNVLTGFANDEKNGDMTKKEISKEWTAIYHSRAALNMLDRFVEDLKSIIDSMYEPPKEKKA